MEPPLPWVVDSIVMALPITDAFPPAAVIAVLIWSAIEFLVEAPPVGVTATAGGLVLVAWAVALSVAGPPLAVRRDVS